MGINVVSMWIKYKLKLIFILHLLLYNNKDKFQNDCMHKLEKELNAAKEAVKKAGKAVLFYYNNGFSVKNKEIGDCPVTEADIKSNEIIIKELENFGYEILSEEKTDDLSRLNKEKVWIIDPLDGTKDFIDKTGDFTIMIGLVEKGEPVLGVVCNPGEKVLYYAVKGNGAYIEKEGREIRKIKISDIQAGGKIKIISSRFHRSPLELKLAEKFGVKDIMTSGSAGLKVSLVAEGKAELNINPSNKTWEWDVCAADIILTEAGGKFTDTKGNKFIYNKENTRNEFGYVASNGFIHEKILDKIKDN